MDPTPFELSRWRDGRCGVDDKGSQMDGDSSEFNGGRSKSFGFAEPEPTG